MSVSDSNNTEMHIHKRIKAAKKVMSFKYRKDKDIRTNEEEKLPLPDIILINQNMTDSTVFCSLNKIY